MTLLPRKPGVTYKDLANLSEQFRDWYFREGGLFLSSKARNTYGKLQGCVSNVLRQEKGKEAVVISCDHYVLIRDKCSALRTEMTKDLQSRRRMFLIRA